MIIKGEFEIKLNPLEAYAGGKDELKLGRMSIDKIFSGELSATSSGEMLSAVTTTPGSAGYVAIEQVSGNLSGKSGSFVLQHFGIMANGEDRLILEVVPSSGCSELIGLTGKMTIDIVDGKHLYEFDYSL